MLKKTARVATIGLLLVLLAAAQGSATTFTMISQPSATYVGGTTLIPVAGADDTDASSVTDGALTVNFSLPDLSAPDIENIPTGWAKWGCPPNTESCSPAVIWSDGNSSMTLNLSTPEAVFGFEAEPNPLAPGIDPMTASFFDSSSVLVGSINLNVDGNAGARLFAVSVSGDTISSVQLTDGNFNDFAIAHLRYSPTPLPPAVPEPASVLLLGTSLAGLALRQLRRKK